MFFHRVTDGKCLLLMKLILLIKASIYWTIIWPHIYILCGQIFKQVIKYFGPDAGFLAMLYTLSVGPRLELDENSIFWENALGLQGLFVTAILMYIILQYHFFRCFSDRLCNIYSYISIQHNLLNMMQDQFCLVFCITIPPLSLAPTSVWPYGITMFTLLFIVLAKNVTIST